MNRHIDIVAAFNAMDAITDLTHALSYLSLGEFS